ncbi:MAG: AAA family ATPase [Rhodospirillaceae bacterium]|nr:AAA family ATPase [Rhodospirillaceae bacterium]
MTISKAKFERFTAFRDLEIVFTPGINILIGANSTGKTHMLKAIYSACDVAGTQDSFPDKLVKNFLPSERRLGRLVHRQKVSTRGAINVFRGRRRIRASFSNHTEKPGSAKVIGAKRWSFKGIECAYIPVKEMLANAPGFRSLYSKREVHFEAIYADIIDRAYRPLLRGPMDTTRRKLLKIIQKGIDGKVIVRGEEFFLRNKQGLLEFTLLAEGLRKLGLLWLLIQNGTLLKGAVFFWEEPETNLNPSLIGTVVEILLELQRMGVQVFLATHDYVVLKEFDLRSKRTDKILYHALYLDKESRYIKCSSTKEYLSIHPNTIADTFLDLYDRDVARATKKSAKRN